MPSKDKKTNAQHYLKTMLAAVHNDNFC